MTTQQTGRIESLRRNGYGYRAIAGATGISLSTVASWCRRHGLDDQVRLGTTGIRGSKMHRMRNTAEDRKRRKAEALLQPGMPYGAQQEDT